MTTSYDIDPVEDQIARGDHDDNLWSILWAVWDRLPTVERIEFLKQVAP